MSYLAITLNKKSTPTLPNHLFLCFLHIHTPSMKISSIWLHASSLYPKASFPAGSLREQRGGREKQNNRKEGRDSEGKGGAQRNKERDRENWTETRGDGGGEHVSCCPPSSAYGRCIVGSDC